MTDFQTIKDSAALQRWCDETPPASTFALDTEFERQKTFFAELCLLQLKQGERIALIDPFAVDLVPVRELAADSSHTWLVHAGRQDLEILFELECRFSGQVLDTQVAAALCGYPEQIGYADLVERLLTIALAKTQTRTDWRRRPLSSEQLSYAADDVRYLPQVATLLQARLTELDRHQWFEQDCAAAQAVVTADSSPESAWERVKGIGKLTDAAFGRAISLAAWREQEARARNRPRGWILSDADLILCAQQNPADKRELSDVLAHEAGVVKRRGTAVLDALQSPPPAELPRRPAKPDPATRAASKQLAAYVREVATGLGLESSVLMRRKDIELAAQQQLPRQFIDNWRYQLLGQDIQRLIEQPDSNTD